MHNLPPARPDEDDLVRRHLALAHGLARQYAHRGVDLDDLEQVAALALLRAVRRFDPAQGDLERYASVSIRGELKRHFRDHAWSVKPPRRIQELRPRIVAAQQELAARQEEAGVATLAAHLGVPASDVAEALAAVDCFRPPSLDDSSGGSWEHGGEVDAEPDRLESWSLLRNDCLGLRPRDRHLLYLRFVEELSQVEIGRRIGVGQMQVSRDLRRVLDTLRSALRSHPAAS